MVLEEKTWIGFPATFPHNDKCSEAQTIKCYTVTQGSILGLLFSIQLKTHLQFVQFKNTYSNTDIILVKHIWKIIKKNYFKRDQI